MPFFVTALLVFNLLLVPRIYPEGVDASGASGRSGSAGADGSDGGGSGSDGDNGQAGRAGGDGENAKSVVLDVQISESNLSVLEIHGQMTTRSSLPGGYSKAIPIKVRTAAPLTIDASGGNGGKGGRGGDGGDGARGRNGSDDEDGGRGGDGGNGGRGGQGGDAGAGGTILTRINHRDSYALKNLDYRFTAGRPGDGGAGGNPGSGGPGGSGGSGHSYTVVTTGSDGTPQVKTEHSPGGSTGRQGSSGSAGNPGASGRPAPNGSVEFQLTFDDGSTRSFKEIFDLEMVSFKVEERTFLDGFPNPGEELWITDLVVKNTGGMPTPPAGRAFMRIEPRSEKWFVENNIVNPSGYIQVPEVIEPGHTYTFKGPVFSFIVDDFAGHAPTEESLKFLGQQLFRARMTVVDQPFTSFDKAREFTIRYPIELTTIRAAPALKVGDRSFGVIKIHNLSDRAIGSLGELQRNTAVDLGVSTLDGTSPAGIDFGYSGHGRQEGLFDRMALHRLEPHQTTDLPFEVSIDEKYAGDDAVQVSASLLFETIHLGDRYIQKLKHTVRLVDPFDQSQNPDIILLTNQTVTRADVTQWREMCARLGLKLAVWNISLYANFDVYAKYFQNGKVPPKFDLVKALQGRTAVVFGGEFKEWGSDKMVDAFHYLSYKQVAKLMSAHETNFLFYGMGEQNREELQKLLIGGDWEETVIPSVAEFKSVFQKQEPRAFGDPEKSQAKAASKLRYISAPRFYKIQLKHHYYWGSPSIGDAAAQAKEVIAFLKQHDPARQFAVSTHYSLSNERPKGYFQTGRYSLGHLEVRSLPAVADAPIVVAEKGDGAPSPSVLAHSLHFKTRLKLVDGLMHQLAVESPSFKNGEESLLVSSLETLLNSIIFDLSHELDAATFSTATLGVTWRDRPGDRLPLHKLLSSFEFRSRLRNDSLATPTFYVFLARLHLLKHYLYTSRSLVYGYIPLTHGLSVAWCAEDYAKKLKKNLFVKGVTPDTAAINVAWQKDFKRAMASLDKASSWYHGFYWRTSKRAAVYQYLRGLTRGPGVETTHDVWARYFLDPVDGTEMENRLSEIEKHEAAFDQYTTDQLDARKNTRNVEAEAVMGPDDFNF